MLSVMSHTPFRTSRSAKRDRLPSMVNQLFSGARVSKKFCQKPFAGCSSVPAHGFPARSRQRRGRHPDLPLASCALRIAERLHIRSMGRRLTLGHSPDALIATLAQALLREDAGFHAYQILEAGVRQFHEWGNGDQGRHILIAVARYLAAHFPTQRALLQTADIAQRLMRGGELHREAQVAE